MACPKLSSKQWGFIAFLIFVLGVTLLATGVAGQILQWFVETAENIASDLVSQNPALALFILFIFMSIAVIFMLPGTPLFMVGMAVYEPYFGFWVVYLVLQAGLCLASLLAFKLGFSILKDTVDRVCSQYQVVGGLVKAAEEEPNKIFVTMSFALIPRGPINYICVMLKCPMRVFLITIVTGCLITDGAAIYVAYSVVQLARSAASDHQEESNPVETVLQVVGMTATLAIFAMLGLKCRKILADIAAADRASQQQDLMPVQELELHGNPLGMQEVVPVEKSVHTDEAKDDLIEA